MTGIKGMFAVVFEFPIFITWEPFQRHFCLCIWDIRHYQNLETMAINLTSCWEIHTSGYRDMGTDRHIRPITRLITVTMVNYEIYTWDFDTAPRYFLHTWSPYCDWLLYMLPKLISTKSTFIFKAFTQIAENFCGINSNLAWN